MAAKNTATAIGAFVFAAGALFVFALGFLGTLEINNKDNIFVLYFDESVNGLTAGAKVKYKGVPIGEVKEVRIRYNQPDESTAIPVFIEIDTERLQKNLGLDINLSDPKVFESQVKFLGLRAQLQMESLVTGVLFVELDYPVRPGPYQQVQLEEKYKEIPTVPSQLAAVGQELTEFVARLSAVDFARINQRLLRAMTDFSQFMNTAEGKIGQVRVAELQESLKDAIVALQDTLQGIGNFVESPELKETIVSLDATLDDFKLTSTEVRKRLPAFIEQLDRVAVELEGTLKSIDAASVEFTGLIAEDSAARYEAERAFSQLAEAARAIRRLADFIERNPKAFITGRSPE